MPPDGTGELCPCSRALGLQPRQAGLTMRSNTAISQRRRRPGNPIPDFHVRVASPRELCARSASPGDARVRGASSTEFGVRVASRAAWLVVFVMIAVGGCGGDGNAPGSPLPSGAARVVVATRHLCVTRGGKVWCWGADYFGQIGQGAPSGGGREKPAQVPGIAGATEVVVSEGHTCALSGGRVKCWGLNSAGETATTSAPPDTCQSFPNDAMAPIDNPCQPTPTEVAGIQDAVQLTVGRGRSCALLASGRVRCWGQSAGGSDFLAAAPDPRAIALGSQTGCVVKSDGGLACGPEWLEVLDTWRDVQRLVMSVDGGAFEMACVLHAGGKVACWGANQAGQRGIGYADYQIPFPGDPIAINGGAVDVAVGSAHACALVAAGEVQCWGRNTYGAVGFPVEASASCSAGPCQLTPRKVEVLPPVVHIAGGGYNTCAMTADNELHCWGQLVGGSDGGPPTHIPGPWETP
jgi:alpha-tubulin suppressor-like RCC1 family protein